MFTRMRYIMPALFVSAVNAATGTTQNSPRILVVYFSMQDGNTGDVARAIQNATGGDIYRIMLSTPYSSDDKIRKAQLTQEIAENTLPVLVGTVPNLEQYDIIFLGSPVWANHLSQPVKSFLNKYDLSGKVVIPFASHSGGGRGKSFDDIAQLCHGCMVDTDGWSSWGGGRQRGIDRWVAKKIALYN